MDNANFFPYNIAVITIRQSLGLDIGENTNGYIFINTGTTIVTVNGVPLNPGVPGTNNGDNLNIGGNLGEIFKGRIDISFVTGVGELQVIQKFYV